MKSLSTIGLALSVIFGCLLLALLAELYYLLWWKKRITRRGIEDGPAKGFFHFFCWKNPSSSVSSTLKPQEICSSNTLVHEPQPQQSHGDSSMDSWLKPTGEESLEAELLRLSGPPRFLFTIKEETKEDLESEEGKSRGDSKSGKGSRTRSLSDGLQAVDTPFLTPIASPPYLTPPLTPLNPFFESTTDFEFSRFARPSPPPTFKFLRDAEEKLYRSKILEEAQRLVKKKDVSIQVDCVKDQESASTPMLIGAGAKFQIPLSSSSVPDKESARVQISPSFLSAQEGAKVRISPSSFSARDEENGSFITLIFPRNREAGLNHQQHHDNVSASQYPSSSSQVLPLTTSPPTPHSPSNFRPLHIRSFTR